LEEVYAKFHDGFVSRDPAESPVVAMAYEWLGDDAVPMSTGAKRWFHTGFHAVEKMETKAPLGIKW
jgi:hypothetical protein